ncbi:hypothetical protein DFH06DRAFT_1348399 [Mycena polygramma]|nr:hypothetical protein DFH06DRAFT_1348399 [Mycena polygramma]
MVVREKKPARPLPVAVHQTGSPNGNGEQHQQPIPVLAPADVQHAISFIQAAYAPSAATDLPQLQSLQSALLAMQRTAAAWGLVVPLFAYTDANVQLFGTHTAHTHWWIGRRAVREGEGAILLQQSKIRREKSGVIARSTEALSYLESLDVAPAVQHLLTDLRLLCPPAGCALSSVTPPDLLRLL